ncbi:MAG: endonuclease III domain-containing protein [Candidatus Omnitrophota bacterium]
MQTRKILEKIYQQLLNAFGPQEWWPADSCFEVMIGAILTQNTNWKNVEKAIANLRKRDLLTFTKLDRLSVRQLAALVKPAGYYNIKSQRIKEFLAFMRKEYKGDVRAMAKTECLKLRGQLLSVKGIGPETADSILLYALNKPIFVVDAYTKRILLRHHLISTQADYPTIQNFFMQHIKKEAEIYNEYHALLVRCAKEFCRATPLCEACPLNKTKYYAKPLWNN